MHRYLLAVLCLCMAPALALAQVPEGKVIFENAKEKPVSGEIKGEFAKGVVIAGKFFAADTIKDVEYICKPPSVFVKLLNPAIFQENVLMTKDLKNPKLDAAQKAARVGDIIKMYADAALAMDMESEPTNIKINKYARRQCAFKIAWLTAKQSEFDPSVAKSAVNKLLAFKKEYKDSWQYGRTLQILAKLQLENKMFAEADKTFAEIAEAPLPEPVRLEASLAGARVSITTGKHAEALQKLDKLLGNLKVAKDHPVAIRARVMQAECQLADKKTSEVGRNSLREIIKDSSDKGVKAAAYNAMGKSLFDDGKLKEARWEFLWVDVVFNQDKNEHAMALYYLWRIFKDLNDLERAGECLETLNDAQFSGTEFQARAQKETKS